MTRASGHIYDNLKQPSARTAKSALDGVGRLSSSPPRMSPIFALIEQSGDVAFAIMMSQKW